MRLEGVFQLAAIRTRTRIGIRIRTRTRIGIRTRTDPAPTRAPPGF
ncbi:MAG: hypothetical protein KME22_06340 [Hassallia sp. WJT32-NPBG1]|jgi:hypothetical protein|nr:hypothetical protein [Hassallia sp. WJT32-NPBG1]